MSYCTWGEDSDVYVLQSDTNADQQLTYCCLACPWLEHAWFETAEEMIAHLMGHVMRGDKVPERAFARLTAEIHGDEGTLTWADVEVLSWGGG